MYSIIKTSHSHLAWLALAAILIAFLVSFLAMIAKKPYGKTEKLTALVGFIMAHTQLLIGLILYFISPYGMSNLSGETMKDPMSRLLALEHPLTNIIAIILISIGYLKAKKLTGSPAGAKTIALYYGIGLVLLLSRIPWATWLG